MIPLPFWRLIEIKIVGSQGGRIQSCPPDSGSWLRIPLAVERKGPGASWRSFLVFTQPEMAGDKGLGHVLGRGLGFRSPLRKVQSATPDCRDGLSPTSSTCPRMGTSQPDLQKEDVPGQEASASPSLSEVPERHGWE